MEELSGSLLQSAKYTSVQALDNITQCTAQSSVPSSHLSSHNYKSFFALTLITMIIITMIHAVRCHVCHLWIKPVSLGKFRQGIRKSGWQSLCLEQTRRRFCLASMQSRPEPHWTVMRPAGESCSCQSPSPPCRISIRQWQMSGMLYHSSMFSGSYPD